jgi:hypothetical protein
MTPHSGLVEEYENSSLLDLIVMDFKRNQLVRCLIEVHIPGWKAICTPGYCFTVEHVNPDDTLTLSRSGPLGRVTVKASDVEPAHKVYAGISYSSRTPETVVRVCETARKAGQRIRVHLGDRETGRDWLEEHDVEGTIGNSMGPTKIPLLIHSRRSLGGPGLLDDAIVKISTTGKRRRTLYQHPTYHTGEMQVVASDDKEFPAAVNVDGKLHARFKSYERAVKWLKKMGGA